MGVVDNKGAGVPVASGALRAGRATQCGAATGGVAAPPTLRVGQGVKLSTRSDCRLNIARYPPFAYDASAGCGSGAVTALDGSRAAVTFDVATLTIPDLNWRSARILGLPLPPPLNIAIEPRQLQARVAAHAACSVATTAR